MENTIPNQPVSNWTHGVKPVRSEASSRSTFTRGSFVVMGASRSPALATLVNRAKDPKEVREIIDFANRKKADGTDVTPEEFEERLKSLSETKEAVSEYSVKFFRTVQNFVLSIENIKLKVLQTFAKSNQKLKEQMDAIFKQSEVKSFERKLEMRRAMQKLRDMERARWDAELLDRGLTTPSRHFILSNAINKLDA